jgi:hypothetical protein
MDEEALALHQPLARLYKYSTRAIMFRTWLDTLQGDVVSSFG